MNNVSNVVHVYTKSMNQSTHTNVRSVEKVHRFIVCIEIDTCNV